MKACLGLIVAVIAGISAAHPHVAEVKAGDIEHKAHAGLLRGGPTAAMQDTTALPLENARQEPLGTRLADVRPHNLDVMKELSDARHATRPRPLNTSLADLASLANLVDPANSKDSTPATDQFGKAAVGELCGSKRQCHGSLFCAAFFGGVNCTTTLLQSDQQPDLPNSCTCRAPVGGACHAGQTCGGNSACSALNHASPCAKGASISGDACICRVWTASETLINKWSQEAHDSLVKALGKDGESMHQVRWFVRTMMVQGLGLGKILYGSEEDIPQASKELVMDLRKGLESLEKRDEALTIVAQVPLYAGSPAFGKFFEAMNFKVRKTLVEPRVDELTGEVLELPGVTLDYANQRMAFMQAKKHLNHAKGVADAYATKNS